MYIAKRIHGLRSLQVALGVVVSYGIFWAWFWAAMKLARGQDTAFFSRYVVYSLLVVLGILADYFRAARWMPPRDDDRSSRSKAASMAFSQTMTVFGILVTFFFAFKDLAISRLFLLTYLPLLWVGLFLVNLYGAAWLTTNLFRGARMQKAVVLGKGSEIRSISAWLMRQRDFGVETVGAILTDDSTDSATDLPLQVLGSGRSVADILREVRASVLIHINLPSTKEKLHELHELCDSVGTRLTIAYDLGPELAKNASFLVEDGTHLMAFRDEPLEAPANRLMKRTLDIMIALAVVTFILPITSVFVWIIHRLQSPGPLFYRQLRTGLHNEQFIIYKYRTMHVDNPEPGRQATAGDDRVFSLGRWLRRTSIDELPQFINVLLGEMSVVGPRPHLEVHDHAFGEKAAKYRVRQLVKPGITGLAQVKGFRGEASRAEDVLARTTADVHYLENWSLSMDLQIIIRTACQMLRPPSTAC